MQIGPGSDDHVRQPGFLSAGGGGAWKGFKVGRNTTPGLCSEVTLAAGMEELGHWGAPDWKHGAGGAGREEALGWDHLRQSGLGDDYLDVRDQAGGETHQNVCGQVSE